MPRQPVAHAQFSHMYDGTNAAEIVSNLDEAVVALISDTETAMVITDGDGGSMTIPTGWYLIYGGLGFPNEVVSPTLYARKYVEIPTPPAAPEE